MVFREISGIFVVTGYLSCTLSSGEALPAILAVFVDNTAYTFRRKFIGTRALFAKNWHHNGGKQATSVRALFNVGQFKAPDVLPVDVCFCAWHNIIGASWHKSCHLKFSNSWSYRKEWSRHYPGNSKEFQCRESDLDDFAHHIHLFPPTLASFVRPVRSLNCWDAWNSLVKQTLLSVTTGCMVPP